MHLSFSETLTGMGYEPVSATVSLEFDLAEMEPRDPRGILIRRQAELDVEEDALPANWWENLALSDFHLSAIPPLLDRSEGRELAQREDLGHERGSGGLTGRPGWASSSVEVSPRTAARATAAIWCPRS